MKSLSTPSRSPSAARLLVPLLVGAAISTLVGCSPPPAAPPVEPVVYVQALNAARADARSERLQATVRPQVETELAFRAAGQIQRRLVDAGSVVKAGQVLAVLEPQDLDAQDRAAQAGVEAASAELDQTRREVERLVRLQGSGASAEVELERQRARLAGLQSRQEQLERQRQLALQRKGYGELRAPFDGVLSQWRAEAGAVVSEGFPVASLARLGAWDAVVDLTETHWNTLQVGRSTALLDVPAAGLSGMTVRLRELSPLAQGSGARLYRARFALPAGGSAGGAGPALAIGMGAELQLAGVKANGTGGYRLPAGALLNNGAHSQVWQVQRQPDGRARLQALPVSVLRQGADWVEVAGLAAEVEVVTMGAQRLREGMVVRPLTQPLASLADERSAKGRP